MTDQNKMDLTRFYLHNCYTCQDAEKCDTEKACKACWEKKGLEEQNEQPQETAELLMEYYA
ncbi:hypothetical protein [Paenibacillus pinihumi]|uniref:hypothetical protein n=1 Tax=Paenibacillus pinihumi TaxID=669462 RepID=UPI0004151920|nr:hypothetical protein [Paenibacillus pinihumi]